MALSRRQIVAAMILAVGSCVWLCSSPSTSPEAQIRRVVEEIEEGVQTAQLPKIMAHISDGYTDEQGWTRDSLSRFLLIQFKKRGPISVVFTPIDITVNEKRAHSAFGVMLTEAERESIMGWPVNAEVLDFKVDFRLEEGQWRVVSHSRQAVFE